MDQQRPQEDGTNRGAKWQSYQGQAQSQGPGVSEPAKVDMFGVATNDPVLKKLQQSAMFAVPSPGTTNDELYRLEVAVSECLTGNGWWFTGGGLTIASYFAYTYNSIRPLALGLVLSPTLDYLYARHHCKPLVDAYHECKGELTQRYSQEVDRVREQVTAAYHEAIAKEREAGRLRPQYEPYRGPRVKDID